MPSCFARAGLKRVGALVSASTTCPLPGSTSVSSPASGGCASAGSVTSTASTVWRAPGAHESGPALVAEVRRCPCCAPSARRGSTLSRAAKAEPSRPSRPGCVANNGPLRAVFRHSLVKGRHRGRHRRLAAAFRRAACARPPRRPPPRPLAALQRRTAGTRRDDAGLGAAGDHDGHAAAAPHADARDDLSHALGDVALQPARRCRTSSTARRRARATSSSRAREPAGARVARECARSAGSRRRTSSPGSYKRSCAR